MGNVWGLPQPGRVPEKRHQAATEDDTAVEPPRLEEGWRLQARMIRAEGSVVEDDDDPEVQFKGTTVPARSPAESASLYQGGTQERSDQGGSDPVASAGARFGGAGGVTTSHKIFVKIRGTLVGTPFGGHLEIKCSEACSNA